MSDAEIPLARPLLGESEEQGVLEVLRSGRLSLGPLLPEFERRFAERIGAPHASAVSSGTAGRITGEDLRRWLEGLSDDDLGRNRS